MTQSDMLPDGMSDAGRPSTDAARRRAHRALVREAAAALLVMAAGLAAAILGLGDRLGMDPHAMVIAFAIYAGIAAVALANLDGHRPGGNQHGRFGAANLVTTVRAAITAAVGGIVLGSDRFGAELPGAVVWALVAVAVLALALDGLDGPLARRRGTASAFGARFDMEVDALLILFLSVAVFLLGKAGAWVLLIGLMRYGFVLGQLATKALRGDLPPSMRRKVICVVQGAALCLSLLPVTGPALAGSLSGAALLLLVYSFGMDVIFLLRARRGGARAA